MAVGCKLIMQVAQIAGTGNLLRAVDGDLRVIGSRVEGGSVEGNGE